MYSKVFVICIVSLLFFNANNSFQVEVIKGCSILAAVGLRMASTPGVSAILFDALAKVFLFLVW
jgi:aspartokinase